MADTKITALTALTAADPANDVIPIVDVSDTTMAASGTTKKISVNNILSSSPTASGALTVTGLVTAGSATITGDLTVRTNKLLVTSTGVGVGMTPITPLSGVIGTTGAVFFRTTDPTAPVATPYIQAPASTGFSSVSPVYGFWYQGSGIGNPALNNVSIITDSTERLKVDLTGNVNISTGNVVMTTSGKGIDFSAVTGGTGTATGNVLNDYEEGTFTPTVIGTTTAGVGVYTVQDAKYTKVGRLVTVEVDLGWSAHTGTGNMQITGLPFTTNATVFTSVTLGYVDNIALTAGNIMTAYTGKSSTTINLNQTPTGGGATTGVPIDVAGRIMVSVTYSV